MIDFTDVSTATGVVAIIGFFIPMLTALVTKEMAPSGLKSVVTFVLSALVGSVGYLVAADGGYDWTGFINGFLNAFIPAIAAYYGLWKATGTAGTVAHKTATLGLGPRPSLTTDDKGAEEAGDPFVSRARHLHRGDTGAASVGVLLLVAGLVLAVFGYVIGSSLMTLIGVILTLLGLVFMFIGPNRRI